MTKKPHYTNHRERLRERYINSGAEGMHDYELLELLLTFAIPRKDVKPLAKNLIAEFGGLQGVLDAEHSALAEFQGMGNISATLIKVSKDFIGYYLEKSLVKLDSLSAPKAVVDFCRFKLEGLRNEAFMILYMNIKNNVIGHQVLQVGTLDTVAVYPRRILEEALSRHASRLVLVHNHPSGNTEPSREDVQLTKEIMNALKPLEIKVLDHIIIGQFGYFSFVENNML